MVQPSKQTTLVAFSSSGHMFAVTGASMALQIFSTLTGGPLVQLKVGAGAIHATIHWILFEA